MKKYDSGIVNKQASLGLFEDATGKPWQTLAFLLLKTTCICMDHAHTCNVIICCLPYNPIEENHGPYLPCTRPPPAVATSLPFFGNPMQTYLLAILEHKETKASAASTVLKRYYSNETKTPY